MTKRIQKAEAKLREDGTMEVLRGNAERGDFHERRMGGRVGRGWDRVSRDS